MNSVREPVCVQVWQCINRWLVDNWENDELEVRPWSLSYKKKKDNVRIQVFLIIAQSLIGYFCNHDKCVNASKLWESEHYLQYPLTSTSKPKQSYTHSLLTSPEAWKSKSKKESNVKVSTRNMNPVNVMRFGASHVGKIWDGARKREISKLWKI